ncbi:uncharacterized protein MONBRDRAFT_5406 [Monosiga brevicollis MX1]|uniref:JmjC domain-containing protein n=1 Tax=Monosiga brevicollis TaxID=81824 RepID=A9UQW3_MONBE|nr:uncharacterized protein MONBRDRAFT_5406 [Monosiga brevicollis MX1]EDQ93115.1 predicted protein [Monosiga brevicollis MX1]|eukprot:XP_001742877.1 hypothetical protein [Monosiga brevicollis MX1]
MTATSGVGPQGARLRHRGTAAATVVVVVVAMLLIGLLDHGAATSTDTNDDSPTSIPQAVFSTVGPAHTQSTSTSSTKLPKLTHAGINGEPIVFDNKDLLTYGAINYTHAELTLALALAKNKTDEDFPVRGKVKKSAMLKPTNLTSALYTPEEVAAMREHLQLGRWSLPDIGRTYPELCNREVEAETVVACGNSDHMYPEEVARFDYYLPKSFEEFCHLGYPQVHNYSSPEERMSIIRDLAERFPTEGAVGVEDIHPYPMCHAMCPIPEDHPVVAPIAYYQRYHEHYLRINQMFNVTEPHDKLAFSMPKFWTTNKPIHTGLHYDSAYNSLTILSGVKHVVLLPPTDRSHVYPVAMDKLLEAPKRDAVKFNLRFRMAEALTEVDDALLRSRSTYHWTRRIAREQYTLANRLLSIEEDAQYLREFHAFYPQLPLYANLRCGRWYAARFDGCVHFKSTDGHRNVWHLAHRRLNLHLIATLRQHGAVLVADATRKGRTLPDSFSRTLPIWAAVISMLADRLRRQQGLPGLHPAGGSQMSSQAHGQDDDATSTDHAYPPEAWLHMPPTTVPPSEQAQVAAVLEDRLQALLAAPIDLSALLALDRPIRCLWFHRGQLLSEDFLPMLQQPDAYVVACVCVSEPVDVVQRPGFLYIQGAGDDEEMWCGRLEPDLFWRHAPHLLELCREGQSDAAILEAAQRCQAADPLAVSNSAEPPSLSIPETHFWLGDPATLTLAEPTNAAGAASSHIPRVVIHSTAAGYSKAPGQDCWHWSFAASGAQPGLTAFLAEHPVTHVNAALPPAKRHRYELRDMAPALLELLREAQSASAFICFADDSRERCVLLSCIHRTVLGLWGLPA